MFILVRKELQVPPVTERIRVNNCLWGSSGYYSWNFYIFNLVYVSSIFCFCFKFMTWDEFLSNLPSLLALYGLDLRLMFQFFHRFLFLFRLIPLKGQTVTNMPYPLKLDLIILLVSMIKVRMESMSVSMYSLWVADRNELLSWIWKNVQQCNNNIAIVWSVMSS